MILRASVLIFESLKTPTHGYGRAFYLWVSEVVFAWGCGLAQRSKRQHREDDDFTPFGDLIVVHDEYGTKHVSLRVRTLRYHQWACHGAFLEPK